MLGRSQKDKGMIELPANVFVDEPRPAHGIQGRRGSRLAKRRMRRAVVQLSPAREALELVSLPIGGASAGQRVDDVADGRRFRPSEDGRLHTVDEPASQFDVACNRTRTAQRGALHRINRVCKMLCTLGQWPRLEPRASLPGRRSERI